MLGCWRSNKDYQSFVLTKLKALAEIFPESVLEYKDSISKMLILNLDPLKDIITPLYSLTGRPAEMQPEIFRSLILMNDLGIQLDNWTEKLRLNPVLRTIAGFTLDNLVNTSSYYDFINRIIRLDERPRLKKIKFKPKEKLKKGEKLPPKNPGIVAKIVNQIINNNDKFIEQLDRRPERFLQKIFAKVCVSKSIEIGIVPDSVSISGDGTCIETGASPSGVKVCNCKEEGNFRCTCDRKFSDPNATWGWDSHKEINFYGYTGYFISTYNKSLKMDLPLYLRLVEASRHDSVSAVFALAEFRELYPDLQIDTFISDSASDNYATYELLNHWGINAVIALNSKNTGNYKYPPALHINDNGVPVCPGGYEMIFNGFCKDRCRFKWRCPCVLGKAEPCEACQNCSPSSYGRVIYTKPDWDLRLFTRIPRGSDAWKLKMKERTAAERVNNRVLNDYGIEESKQRGKKRISFFTTIAGFNIHLDAQLKKLTADNQFDFYQIFNINKAA